MAFLINSERPSFDFAINHKIIIICGNYSKKQYKHFRKKFN